MFGKINKTIFGVAVVLYLCLFLFIALAPGIAGKTIGVFMDFTLNTVGFVYIAVFLFILAAFLAIGLSRFGKIRLGEGKPEFSFFSWMGLLFGAGLGVGLVFYGVSEPVTHFMTAPFAESGTAKAASEAMRTTFFHWTFLPWGCYGAIGLCMAYFLHCKGLPTLVSSSFKPMLGEGTQKMPGRIIDAFSLVALVCGVAMSLGFATVQLVSGLNLQYGIPNTFLVICSAAVIIGILATVSAISGVDKGIKYISDGNMYIVLFFLLFTLGFGSTSWLVKSFFENTGNLLANLPWMIFFMDSYGEVAENTGFNWLGSWTIMYWAWWVAFAPFVGGFLARISKGRTIREFVLACVFVPGLLCCLWFTFFGGSAIAMDLFGNKGIGETIMVNTDNSLFVFLAELPISVFTIPLSMLLIVTLIVTSVNSATYVAGQFSAGGDYVPSLGIRAFWGVFIVINALMFIHIGGLPTLKNAAIVLAFPFSIIAMLMVVNLVKDLRKSYPV
jgi:glycine betaine transporter